MNFNLSVSRPTAHAINNVSGSYRLKESRVDSIPASSALCANLTQPSMSGRAAGELLLVVATREVSWTVFMPTSPPFGNIQWNLRFIVFRGLNIRFLPPGGAHGDPPVHARCARAGQRTASGHI